jgi:hypothetical protein
MHVVLDALLVPPARIPDRPCEAERGRDERRRRALGPVEVADRVCVRRTRRRGPARLGVVLAIGHDAAVGHNAAKGGFRESGFGLSLRIGRIRGQVVVVVLRAEEEWVAARGACGAMRLRGVDAEEEGVGVDELVEGKVRAEAMLRRESASFRAKARSRGMRT